MEDILTILTKNTKEAGSYTISFNRHTDSYYFDSSKDYEAIKDYYLQGNNEEDMEEYSKVDFSKDIYELTWYNLTPNANYTICVNSLEDLKNKIIKVIENGN